jgi:hypothetical protein
MKRTIEKLRIPLTARRGFPTPIVPWMTSRVYQTTLMHDRTADGAGFMVRQLEDRKEQ